jgi:hypothetical protein
MEHSRGSAGKWPEVSKKWKDDLSGNLTLPILGKNSKIDFLSGEIRAWGRARLNAAGPGAVGKRVPLNPLL